MLFELVLDLDIVRDLILVIYLDLVSVLVPVLDLVLDLVPVFVSVLQSMLDPTTYSLRTRNTITRLNVDRVNLDLVLDLIQFIDVSEEFRQIDGALLVFLPGMSHIQELTELLHSDRNIGDSDRSVLTLILV